MSRPTPIACGLALVVLALPGLSEGAAETVVFSGGHATMTLPEGWQELDPGNLEELSMWFAEATAGRAVEFYQHGYRPPDYETDPWLPHLLVQIRESGRLRYGPFLDLPPVQSFQGTPGEAPPLDVPPLVLNASIERLYFDRERFCLRLEHALDLRFKGPVRVFSAAFLTERGTVALHYADRERRSEDARARFDTIVDSVAFDAELRYRPELSDRWPGLPFFTAALVTALATIAYLVVRRLRA